MTKSEKLEAFERFCVLWRRYEFYSKKGFAHITKPTDPRKELWKKTMIEIRFLLEKYNDLIEMMSDYNDFNVIFKDMKVKSKKKKKKKKEKKKK